MVDLKVCSSCSTEKLPSEFYLLRGKPVARCKACALLEAEKYRAANREKVNAGVRAWRRKYPERALEADRKKRAKNPEKYREIDRRKQRSAAGIARGKRYKEANKDRVKLWNAKSRSKNPEKGRAATLRWQRENRDKARAIKATRRAIEINAQPKWADKQKMKAFFVEAKQKTEETGIVHHVDHIVPLNSPIVCGLHCEFNLQVLTGVDNISKSNRFWPYMPSADVWDWVQSEEFKAQWKLLCSDLPKRERPPSMWEAIPAAERSRMATERNLAAWKKRTPEQRAEIGRRISAGIAQKSSGPIDANF